MESLKSVGAMILTWISETLKGFEDDKGSMNQIKESDGKGDLMTSDFNI